MHGQWIPPSPNSFGGFCVVTKAQGYDDLPLLEPPLFSTATYRVAYGATISGVWQRVAVEARHFPIIY
jgi:hypothetical protein